METKLLLFSTIFIFAYFSFPPAYASDDECIYVVYVQTGNAEAATTHARVSLELRDKYVNRLNMTNLQYWGLMGKHHYYDYFKRGNLDVFSVKGKCFNGPFCSMTLSHDNTGVSPSWYVDYVEVTSVAPNRHCRKIKFPVNAWLSVDEPPRGLANHGVYLCDEMIVADHANCSSEI